MCNVANKLISDFPSITLHDTKMLCTVQLSIMQTQVANILTNKHTDFAGLTLQDPSTKLDKQISTLLPSLPVRTILLFLAFSSIFSLISGVTLVAFT